MSDDSADRSADDSDETADAPTPDRDTRFDELAADIADRVPSDAPDNTASSMESNDDTTSDAPDTEATESSASSDRNTWIWNEEQRESNAEDAPSETTDESEATESTDSADRDEQRDAGDADRNADEATSRDRIWHAFSDDADETSRSDTTDSGGTADSDDTVDTADADDPVDTADSGAVSDRSPEPASEPIGGDDADDTSDSGTDKPDSDTDDRLWNTVRSARSDDEPADTDSSDSSESDRPATEPPHFDAEDGDDERLWNRMGTDEKPPEPSVGGADETDFGGLGAPLSDSDAAEPSAQGRSGIESARPRTGRSGGSSGTLDELDRAASGSNTLVLSPTGDAVADAACARLLSAGASGRRNALFVTVTESASDRVEICRRADWEGGEIAVVELGSSRSGSSASEMTTGVEGDSITVKRISNPADISKLGIVITRLLTQWEDKSRPTVLCFHTLTALLQYVGSKQLFRFLDILQRRLRSMDATGHYHMHPEEHDALVLETFRPAFDSVVRLSKHGDVEIE